MKITLEESNIVEIAEEYLLKKFPDETFNITFDKDINGIVASTKADVENKKVDVKDEPIDLDDIPF